MILKVLLVRLFEVLRLMFQRHSLGCISENTSMLTYQIEVVHVYQKSGSISTDLTYAC